MPNLRIVGVIAYRNPDTQEFMRPKPLYKPDTAELQQQREFLHKACKDLIAAGLLEYINAINPAPKEQKKEE